MESLAGTYVDGLIAIAASGIANGRASDLLREVRVSLRAGRPDREWVATETTVPTLREALLLLGDDQSRSSKALRDAISCTEGTRGPLEIWHTWGRELTKEFDPHIELSIFRGNIQREPDESRRFLQHINSDEPLEMIIRGHLWIESKLISLLNVATPVAKHLESARLSFTQMIYVAAAMGLIDEKDLPALFKLNKFRNKIAHFLEAEISQQDEDELVACVSPRVRAIILRKDQSIPGFPTRLREVIATLMIGFESTQDQIIAAQRYRQYLHHQVDKTLGRSPKPSTAETTNDGDL